MLKPFVAFHCGCDQLGRGTTIGKGPGTFARKKSTGHIFLHFLKKYWYPILLQDWLLKAIFVPKQLLTQAVFTSICKIYFFYKISSYNILSVVYS